MSKGKAASQAGHAYLGAFVEASQKTPQQASDYHKDGIGTKVCLGAGLDEILIAKMRADIQGIPNFLVTDSGHESFFNGQPTITALGLGPEIRQNINPITGHLQLLK